MELRLYSKMLLRSWWIVALTALAAINVALVQVYRSTPIYETSTRFIVSPSMSGVDSLGDFIYSMDALSRKSTITSYAEALQSRQILQSTITEIGIDAASIEAYEFSAVVVPDSNLLELFVRGDNPSLVTLLANGIGVQAIDYMSKTYMAYTMRVMDPAAIPEEPIAPNPKRIVAVAMVMGVAVGVVLAIVREQLRLPLEALLQRGMVDSVSWAYKRTFFEHRLRQEIASNTDGPLSIGLIHLEGLQDVVDRLPRPILQRSLRHVTHILQHQLRGSDVFGRWGEVTFGVLLPETPDAAAVRTLERIQQALEKPLDLGSGDEEILLNPRIGGVSYIHHEPYKVLLERLESATELSRQNGKKTIFIPIEELVDNIPRSRTKALRNEPYGEKKDV